MSNNSGETINSFWSFVDLYDILYIENLYNLTLPVWAKDILAEENDSLCGFAWAVDAYTTELGRLISGPLIDVIVGHFENITNNVSDTPKFLMLSAHDMTIATLLTTLQIYDYKWPQYSSTVLFELRKGPQNNYVNIFYKNVEEAVNKTLPNCDFNCGLEDFGKLVEPVRINLQQRDEECNITE
ncbi:hypothetical protein NQ317_005028 [Molorchus minor]|uniref:acid phosphatase n=1 Tax=Molorchus minor TaxID=1323400 RepID=A0ABQ9JXH6_9CUCU|nr:hypothetical protein NQ317_005028 [Molorchus minor]